MRKLILWTLVACSALFAALMLSRPQEQNRASTPEGGGLTPAAEPSQPERVAPIALTDPQPLPDILINPSVRISKALRRLTVFSDGEAQKGYRIALGREPDGDKEREGDGKTPEGQFYICSRNPESKFRLALGLSYPNEDDADRGLAAGLISKREHRTIVSAIHHFERPPWKTALGGEIMIHGAGSGRGDWTQGCIALDDTDIEELYRALPLGTPVEIVP